MTLANVTFVELSVPAASTPRAVLAVAALVAPVPPLLIGTVLAVIA